MLETVSAFEDVLYTDDTKLGITKLVFEGITLRFSCFVPRLGRSCFHLSCLSAAEVTHKPLKHLDGLKVL